MIRGNRRLTVREVSEEVGISKSSCNSILIEKLLMHRVAAKFVPRLLSDEQRQNRSLISQELLQRAENDQEFLKSQEMKPGFMAMMLKQRDNHLSGLGHHLLDRKKHVNVVQASN